MPDHEALDVYRTDLGAAEVGEADALRVRTLAAWAYLKAVPSFFFLRQRSEFIQGWRMAAQAGAAVADAGATAGATGVAGAPAIGSWMLLPELTDERTRGSVLPMNDGLYGAAHLELGRHGPVVLGVPASLGGRYWSVGIHDAFYNAFAHLGPKWTGEAAGEHLLVGPGWDGEVPAWATSVIRAPTPSVGLLNRVLVLDDAGDVDRVRAWRTGLTITALDRRGTDGPPMPEVATDDLVHADLRGIDDPLRFLRLAFSHLDANPPPVQDAWLLELLRTIDLDRAGEDAALRAIVEAGVRDGQRILDGRLSSFRRVNGWRAPFVHVGEQGPWLLEQAVTQMTAIGSNDPAEAVYLYADQDADGGPLDVSDGSVRELVLGPRDLPPLDAGGFWSVTMYRASDQYLVANPHRRFSTRTDRHGFVLGPDGTARIVFAVERPDGVADANWLPAPDDGPFLLGLRLYYPQAPIREGTWFPPAVTPAA